MVPALVVSSAPSVARACDQGLGDEPAWRDVFEGYRPAAAWLEALAPDALVVVYKDHGNRFFFDAYPPFALGVAAECPQADEGWGRRDLPDLAGHQALG